MPDGFLASIVFVLVVIGVLLASREGAEGVQRAFQGYFAGYRPDPWPRGVQEEDGVRAWGTYIPSRQLLADEDVVDEPTPSADPYPGWANAQVEVEDPRDQADPRRRAGSGPGVRVVRVKASVHARG